MMKRAVILVVFLIVLGIAYYFLVNRTKEVSKKHAYDGIANTQQDPHWRATTSIRVLSSKSARKDLEVTDDQAAKLDEIFSQQTEKSKQLWADWRKKNPDIKVARPFQADGTKELAVETQQTALKILNSKQRQRLKQLELQSMGWDFVHLDAVRRRLALTPQQIKKFKDLKVDEIKLRMEWRRKTSAKAPPDEIKQVENQLKEFKDKYLQVLTSEQRNRRTALLGKLVDLRQ